MCGRFALTQAPIVVEEHFAASGVDAFPPRYNIAPTQPIMVVGPAPTREAGSNLPLRHAFLVRWGFIPGWVKDVKQFPMLINARSETAAEKASFRAAMRHRRVLIPASGFYEWRKLPGKRTQPYWIRPRHGGVFAFGGLIETYSEPGGSEIDTGAILTTAATGELAAIHDRAPVVVMPEDYTRWLDCITQEPRDVSDIMRPSQPDFFEAIPVSDKVNKVANVGPDLQDKVAEPPVTPRASVKRDDQLSLF